MIDLEINNDNELVYNDVSQIIEYTPDPIDEYIVIVNDPNDWEEIHNYIINENEIDGIPNRKIECINEQIYSVRSSIYYMSQNESELLKSHPKIETVELNPEKYPQSPSLHISRFGKNVAFNKPQITSALDNETVNHENGIRSNWSILFANNPSSSPFRGVGIASTTQYNTDIDFSLSGKNVDAVILDSGIGHMHPEFKNEDGTYRAKDLILDGPYKVDPNYFNSRNLTYTKILDGVNLGVGIATTAAHNWWGNSSLRSPQFQSLGTVIITSSYTLQHCASKTPNINGNQIINSHGTACASQIGGKSFGLAFECNIWGIRVALSDWGGYLDPSVATNACTIFHNAKKIAQNGDPDPTITSNSYGFNASTPNASGSVYTHGYRGSTLNYTGTGSDGIVPTNSGSCRNHKQFSCNISGTNLVYSFAGSGSYNPTNFGVPTDVAAESAISSGVIIVTSAGNTNQKLSDATDLDFNNWIGSSSTYINRVGGIQKGFSGTHTRKSGSIRVGALDCAVEPSDSKQGSSPYSIRKVTYSANGPMITIWAPGEMTMAAAYSSSETFVRQDNSSFYDYWFNGTSAACPNAVSLICLYLQANRKANQLDVINWLDTHGSIEIALSDPYPDPTQTGYWSQTYNATFDSSSTIGDSYNVRGNGNLRGATKKVIHNPYANPTGISSYANVSGLSMTGVTINMK